ncbi:ankyrin repeat domain-containing protein [Kistimonas asteriae]|uniref:ankyrin repeat domain-containing protein n=1 Tax=Kistimonas asteriae TaxID=517724 RepID=UPI001BACE615|nr:ankyrin repeat domain-containing protein [Kistimonas asteriae]
MGLMSRVRDCFRWAPRKVIDDHAVYWQWHHRAVCSARIKIVGINSLCSLAVGIDVTGIKEAINPASKLSVRSIAIVACAPYLFNSLVSYRIQVQFLNFLNTATLMDVTLMAMGSGIVVSGLGKHFIGSPSLRYSTLYFLTPVLCLMSLKLFAMNNWYVKNVINPMWHSFFLIDSVLEDKQQGRIVHTFCKRQTPIHLAAMQEDETCMRYALHMHRLFFDINSERYEVCPKSGDGLTNMLAELKSANTDDFRAMLAQSYNKLVSRYGYTALQIASVSGIMRNIALLLENKADINKMDNEVHYASFIHHPNDEAYKAPIHLVTEQGHTDCLEMLLDFGADINLRTANLASIGYTALHIATDQNFTECAALLLNRGADCGMLGSYFWGEKFDTESGLHIAARKGYIQMLKLLLESGAEIDQLTGKRKRSALHLAVEAGHYDNFEMLMDAGADIHVKDGVEGKSVLHVAAESGSRNCVLALLNRQANVNELSANDRPVLHHLLIKGDNPSMVALFIALGANMASLRPLTGYRFKNNDIKRMVLICDLLPYKSIRDEDDERIEHKELLMLQELSRKVIWRSLMINVSDEKRIDKLITLLPLPETQKFKSFIYADELMVAR